MAWKTIRLDVSKEFELDDKDLFVEITPMVWLPERVMLDLMRKSTRMMFLQSKMGAFADFDMNLSEEDQAKSEAEQAEILAKRADDAFEIVDDAMNQLRPLLNEVLQNVVVAWNLKDEHGVVMPTPAELIKQSREGEIDKNLPLQLRMWIMSSAQDQTEAVIPLENGRPSNGSSADQLSDDSEKMPSIASNSSPEEITSLPTT